MNENDEIVSSNRKSFEQLLAEGRTADELLKYFIPGAMGMTRDIAHISPRWFADVYDIQRIRFELIVVNGLKDLSVALQQVNDNRFQEVARLSDRARQLHARIPVIPTVFNQELANDLQELEKDIGKVAPHGELTREELQLFYIETRFER